MTLQAAQRSPLVVVIEDLHWIDPASEEYLAFLADVIAGTQALLVCSHRPGYRHPFGDRSYHVRISLRPLAAADIATMTGTLFGVADIPAELLDLIARKAEGNRSSSRRSLSRCSRGTRSRSRTVVPRSPTTSPR